MSPARLSEFTRREYAPRMTLPHRSVCILLVLALAIFVLLPAAARAQSATGDLEGLIVDQQSSMLPGVTVTITSTATGTKRSIVTDEHGLFRAPLLPVGDYDLTAELNGFKPH